MSINILQTAESATDVDLNRAEYDAMLPSIMETEANGVIIRSGFPSILTGEAETLCNQARLDIDTLVKAGLPVDAVDRLSSAAGALRYAQAMLEKHAEERVGWKFESPAAFTLHGTILHHFLFAYRNDREKIGKVRAIVKGATNYDKIQQLQTLAVFGRENRAELEAVGFDFSLLDKAGYFSARLGDLLGEHKMVTKQVSEARMIRDKAYVYLRQLMKLVREFGKYVFYQDKKRMSGYTSEYYRKMNKRYKKEDVPDTSGNTVLKTAA